MTNTFAPRFDTLPDAQRRLWPELAALPTNFVLYGGTALALRLGHRESVDFDFFSPDPLEPRALLRAVPWLRSACTLHEAVDTLTVLVDVGVGSVKVSLFGGIDQGRVGEPSRTRDDVLLVASLLDVGGCKVKVVMQPIEAKDYLDVAALLVAGLSLEQLLAAGMSLFGPPFNPLVAQKTLSYFDGGDLDGLPSATKRLLVEHATRELDPRPLPKLSARLDLRA
jgi:hypothetical protein